jgi:hypothetical protein
METHPLRNNPLTAHSGNVQCKLREGSVHSQGTFSAHSGNVQCKLREGSVHIQRGFGAQSG